MFHTMCAILVLMSSGAGDQLELVCLIKSNWNGCSRVT